MHVLEVHKRTYLQFERLRNAPGLRHAFATRPLDLAPRGAPRGRRARAARRRQMAADLGFDPDRLCYCLQVHRTAVAVIDRQRRGGGLAGCDAALTALPGVPLMTFSADCALILVYDPARRVVGLGHASWRCTLAAMARRVVETLCARFGSRPRDLLAGIGPAAGPCCYEVGRQVRAAAAGLPQGPQLFENRGGRIYFDLWRANRAQLVGAGLRPERVETSGLCTVCRGDLFYSLRREGADCGRFGLLAGISAP